MSWNFVRFHEILFQTDAESSSFLSITNSLNCERTPLHKVAFGSDLKRQWKFNMQLQLSKVLATWYYVVQLFGKIYIFLHLNWSWTRCRDPSTDEQKIFLELSQGICLITSGPIKMENEMYCTIFQMTIEMHSFWSANLTKNQKLSHLSKKWWTNLQFNWIKVQITKGQ